MRDAASLRPADGRIGMITKIARMYHEQGVRQTEIADVLHISQSRVSRYLKDAVALGIVRTIVTPPSTVHTELELELRDQYGLLDVVITATAGAGDEPSVVSSLGTAGADYLEVTLTQDDRVGISSWSATLLATVDAMRPRRDASAAEIVQLLGGVGEPSAQVRATHLVERLAQISNAEARYLSTPGIVSSRGARDILLADPYVSSVAEHWKQLTVALVGIGSLTPSPLLASSGNAVSAEDQVELRALGAVGDVCLQFFNESGAHVSSELDDRTVGIDRQQLLAVPRRVGIAGGSRKHQAIRGAVLGGWVNVLITDLETAQALAAV